VKDFIPRPVILNRVFFLESHGIVYLANPKCASSSIKVALRRLAGETWDSLHSRKGGPFVEDIFDTGSYRLERLQSATVFSVVRNPYRRALSAYTDKVHAFNKVWRKFCLKQGIESKAVTFREFLRMLDGLAPRSMDPHFRPQWLNVLYPTRGTTLLKLEEPEAITLFFHAHGMDWPVHENEARVEVSPLEEAYDGETEALVGKIYADDFRCFGYPLALEQSDAPGDMPPIPADAPSLAERITGRPRRRRVSAARVPGG
jgi:hypothetical protein